MHHVILGAGPAGVTAAETIRKTDPDCQITLVGGEPEPPYSRMAIPYLLAQDIDESGTYLRQTDGHYENLGIQYVHGRAASIDVAGKAIKLDDGGSIAFDKLLISTGATPVRPPIDGLDLPGVHHCWTMQDTRHIMATAQTGDPVVLMGAGFIGSIILEALVRRGVALTVVEMGDRMVPRMMDEVAGNMLKRWCEKKGVRVLTSTKIMSLSSDGAAAPAAPPQPAPAPAAAAPTPAAPAAAPKKEKYGFLQWLFGNPVRPEDRPTHNAAPEAAPAPVAAPPVTPASLAPVGASSAPGGMLSVQLDNGESIPAKLVVVAAGVRSNIDFLEGSGIKTEEGIWVDEYLQTNVPDIYAAGDVAEGIDLSTGEREMLAIQPVAVEHGRVAGQNMAGKSTYHRGSLNMNVLDTLGLISSSFGSWMGVEGGESGRMVDEENDRYLRLEFSGDKLVGMQSVGTTEHVGMARGLIQTGLGLGEWKERLIASPARLPEAYVAVGQGHLPL